MADPSAEFARAGAPLRVATRISPHQHISAFLAKTLHDQALMAEQYLALFERRWIGNRRFSAQAARGFFEKPRPAQRSAGDHHAVDAILLKRGDNFLGRIQI